MASRRSELDRIKDHKCTLCGAKPRQPCRKVKDATVIYPYAPGAASEEGVHVPRRNAAIKAGVIKDD